VGVAELVDWSRRMQGKGVSAPGLSLSWPDLIRFKRTFTDPVPERTERSFAEAGIAMRHGRAHFVDRTTIQVGDDTLVGRHVVIATGARHAPLGIAGEELLTTSTQFLELDNLPPRIVFVGGGYIAFEFAHIAARAGMQVQILHRGARPLEKFEPDLDEAGVAREKHGVSVNMYLQSVSNPAVYAAGDAVASGGFPLTPVAGMQGDIVAHNLLEGNRHTPNYTGIPSVVFTTPPLARVGLSEEAARAQGLHFRTHREDTSGWYSSRRVALPHTGSKVLVEDGTDRLLGAHLLGLHAEEVINLFALAIRAGLRASDLKTMVYAYPTSASDIGYML
jgi:glutathione reductase (NADPH)